MAYFPLTGKLLSETTFLTFISRVNEEFISLDSAEYESYQEKGKSFTLTPKAWLSRAKEAKTVTLESGETQSFSTFASNRLKALINFDIDNYIKDFKSGKIEDKMIFGQELSGVKEHISNAPYLSPIADELLTTFDRIPTEIITPQKQVDIVAVREGKDYLTWNGPVADLFSLFSELRTTKSSISSKTLLDYTPEDLGAFIIKHFRDSNGNAIPESSIAEYLQNNNEGPVKKGKVKNGR
jgi:hypothetical protein